MKAIRREGLHGANVAITSALSPVRQDAARLVRSFLQHLHACEVTVVTEHPRQPSRMAMVMKLNFSVKRWDDVANLHLPHEYPAVAFGAINMNTIPTLQRQLVFSV